MNILLIPDGHRRWAKEKDIPLDQSYETSCQRIVDICEYLGGRALSTQMWLGVLTPFNLQRPSAEANAILDAGLRLYEIGKERGYPLNVTANGRLDLLPGNYADRYLEQAADQVDGAFTLHNMLGWMANTEVTGLARWAQEQPAPVTHADLVAQSDVKEHVDFVVRTGTAGRLSAMAPWHSLDAEMYFTKTLFPDFTLDDFGDAIEDYNCRDPRNDTWPAANM